MPKISDHFSGRYLKADHCGKGIKLRIKEYTEEPMPDGEMKLVVWFEDEKRGLVLNNTNANAIGAIANTDELDDARGFWIVLYKTQTDMRGQMVDCIRVREPQDGSNDKVRNAAQAAEAAQGDDIPF